MIKNERGNNTQYENYWIPEKSNKTYNDIDSNFRKVQPGYASTWILVKYNKHAHA